jgi:hypothetical protein
LTEILIEAASAASAYVKRLDTSKSRRDGWVRQIRRL